MYSHRHLLAHFFHWLTEHDIAVLDAVTAHGLAAYQHGLETRANRVRGGGLGSGMIYNYLHVLQTFDHYLRCHGLGQLPVGHLQLPVVERAPREPLTREEVGQLYAVTGEGPVGYRDRAMLSLYYGCGLRKSEGAALRVDDIDWGRQYLHIRHGKGAKPRYVPFQGQVAADLRGYFPYYREQLVVRPTSLFLLGQRGRITGESLNNRLKQLASRAGLTKPVYLHVLRHSIATHLMQAGMSLESIASFLGHSTLEATQVYTHVTPGAMVETDAGHDKKAGL